MVKIDEEACIGCGLCEAICGDVFELNKEGKAVIKKNTKKDSSCIKEAIDSCPVNCINS